MPENHWQLAIRNSPPTILFFTRFVEVEPAWLAEFWRALAAQLPNAQLIVAGNALQAGRELLFQQQMQQIAPAAAVQVKWLGYVPPAQLEQLYPTLACAIFPAMNVPLLQAKCSVKLVTTLLHGVPVVASAVGEQAAYGAEGAACLVDAEASPAQFAEAVIRVLQEPEQQRLLVQRAQAHLLARYRWSHLGEQLAAFYRTVLAQTR
jgi:glycosyltransferase involved in cell wall biosynthesis